MPIIDLHCDTIDRLYGSQAGSLLSQQSLSRNEYHIDLNKLKTSGYLAQWFAIFIDTKTARKPLMVLAREMYDYFMQQLALNQEVIELATSYEEYEKIKSQHKIAAFLSLEEGQVIAGSLEHIKTLWDLGIRMMTLTWNYENELGAPHDMSKGLTPFGKQAVEYLKTFPMLLDISHLSEAAVKEIKMIYQKPIIASHCNARTVCDHTRNLSDEVIRIVADSGGVMGLNLYGVFLDGSHKSTIQAMCSHIAHMYKIGGEEILALGTDFDGINCDLEVCHAGEMGKLIEALRKIYSSSFIDKLTHKNAERVFKENLT